MAWVALVPLLWTLSALARRSGSGEWRRAFLLGSLTGFVYFAGTVYWTKDVMAVYGGLPAPIAIALAGLLAAYLAVYVGVFAALVLRVEARLGLASWGMVPIVWVAAEYGRGTLFSGFPWVLLGYSQTSIVPLIQMVSVTGVYGLSALVALVNATVVYVLHPRPHRAAVIASTVALVASLALWGENRVAASTLTNAGAPITVGVVQGNVPQNEKWDRAFRDRILHTYLTSSREAAARGARLIIWPESSTPFLFEEDPIGGEAIRRLVHETGTWLLLGSDQVLRQSDDPVFFNAAFMLDPTGATVGVYHKNHLVPWGEYVPLRDYLFFVAPLVDAVGEFAPGKEMVALPVAGRALSTAICYEVVFPSLIRESVLKGSQLLTTITNDAWYGFSSAPYQHFAQASLRAVEQGRYLVRSANTGISGFVDPYGRVIASSPLFETTTLVEQVRFLEDLTIYGQIGDVVPYACVAITLIVAFIPRRVHTSSRRSQ